MWRPYYVTAAAEGFNLALDGGPAAPAAQSLARFASGLAGQAPAADGLVSERGRQRLLAAVAARKASRPVRAGAVGAWRTGAMVAASVAGGGLLIAGAGSAPAELARDALESLHFIDPRPANPPVTPTAVSAMAVALEGTVVAVRAEDATFDLAQEGRVTVVRTGDATAFRWSTGVAATLGDLRPGLHVAIQGTRIEGEPVKASVVEARGAPLAVETRDADPSSPGPGAAPSPSIQQEPAVEGRGGPTPEPSAPKPTAVVDPGRAPDPSRGTGSSVAVAPTPDKTPAALGPTPTREPVQPPPTWTKEPARTATPKRTATPVPTRPVDPPPTATPTPVRTRTPAPVPTMPTDPAPEPPRHPLPVPIDPFEPVTSSQKARTADAASGDSDDAAPGLAATD